MSNVTKLTSTNYLMWSRQVHALFDGYELAGFLDGSTTMPPATIGTDAAPRVNPDYTRWKRQDKLIYSAVLGAISMSVQPAVSRATTAAQIWETLRKIYANPSYGHVTQFRTQLKQWTKGTKTIDDYMQGFVTHFDQLALLGKPMDHDEQVERVLENLPEEYKPVIDQIAAKDTPPTLTEIHERLLNQESKILAVSSATVIPITANAVSHRNTTTTTNNNNGNRTNRYDNRNNNNNSKPWQQSSSNFRPNNNQSKPYLGKCQICGVQGHSAKRCSQLQHFLSSVNSQQPPSPFTLWQPRANLALGSPYSSNSWLLDSGATHHITSDFNNLSLHQPYTGGDDVMVVDGSTIPISHTGSTSLSTKSRPLNLHNILYVPNIHKNLISVYRLCNANGVSVEFFLASFQVKDLNTGVPLLQGKTKDELYEWPIASSQPVSLFASPSSKATHSSWHARLGHPAPSILNSVISNYSLSVLNPSHKFLSCLDSLINKSNKVPFSQSTINSTRPLEYIYSDVWSSPILSHDNYRYYVIFVDHFTRYTWLYPLKQKSQVKETFITFKNLVENRFQTRIGTFYSDNGGEFVALREYFSQHGISHLTSPPHTPEHNGLSERKHRHIVETGLTLLSHASIPKTYWPYAFAVAVYLINRLPTPLLQLESPCQKLFGTSPNYDKLRVFGCACYPWLRPYNQHKLDDKSRQCVFLGYSLTQSAYLCLHLQTSRIYISRHVRFDENCFPFSNYLATLSPVQEQRRESSCVWSPHTTLPTRTPVLPAPSCSDPHHAATPPSSPSAPSRNSQVSSSNLDSSFSSSFPSSPEPTAPRQNGPQPTTQPTQTQTQTHSSQNTSQNNPTNESPSQLAQSLSTPAQSSSSSPSPTTSASSSSTSPTPPSILIHPPPPLAQIVNNNNQAPINTHSMGTRAKAGIIKPNLKYSLAVSLAAESEPRTAIQALKDERWRNAMGSEINAQIGNHTWDLVPPPPSHVTIVGCRWIFTKKYNSDGSLNRYKARLVAKGYNQRPGLDYVETFSPVIKSTSIRIVLGVAVDRSWPIRQLDVNNAFLQGTLTDDVYMSQPPGFIDKDRPNYVCKLRKALYGLKQAPRAWYVELRNYLLTIGFVNSVSDTSLFVLQRGKSIVYMLVYVDDILITGNDPTLLHNTLDNLSQRFSVKDHEELHYFLGIEAKRVPTGLHLSQRRYILDLLARTNMITAKPVTTPMAPSPKLSLYSGTKLTDPTEYRGIVGSLQYLAFTRPDISYAVNRLSQFMHMPTEEHLQALKRILRYLAGTPNHGIFLKKGNTLSLHAYSDADWTGDKDDYVSTNGYIVYLGHHPISWSSKKQKGVVRSSTEAEYRSVANTSSEMQWICSLLTELGIRLTRPPVIYCDNVGATYLCANPVFHSRMKHIAIDYHFIRNQVQSGALRVVHVSTHDQLADTLTKPLSRTAFQNFASKIGVTRVPPS
uniref:Polyprotein n=1 Tax=Arabidopsis thaliana TaxID=3702 RepID=Q9SXQ3_ARATH|nr:polyprotein [Arabidopsis thaliana]BAK41505.1 polyprotein [Arabidopsis thaliana]BAK41506.1 polyprotein [Arabidopsis thaliana]BAK41508.1 polyprotein [Arabidopsis thaliana]BAK41509.1 polyprotein [Arabidopsis thaliana]